MARALAGQHNRGSTTAPAADPLTKVTAIGQLPEEGSGVQQPRIPDRASFPRAI